MASQPNKVRVLVFQEGETWVAQCLEYDIGAQAGSLKDLRARFDAVFEAECRESVNVNGAPFEGIGPAPEHFQEMWKRASGFYTPNHGAQDHASKYQMAMVA